MKTNHTRTPTIQTPANSSPATDQRSPLEFPFGCFVADTPGYGGAQTFLWFPSEVAVLAYLRTDLASLYEEGKEATKLSNALAEAIGDCKQLASLDLERVNLALIDACEVRWVGGLDNLRLGDTPFEREIQWDFNENVFGDERGHADSDLADFAHHLEHYTQ
jgi:hypothetical protein